MIHLCTTPFRGLRWWNLSGECIHSIPDAHADNICSLARFKDTITTCGCDMKVVVWNATTYERLQTFPSKDAQCGHTAYVISCDMFKDLIVSSGRDNCVMVCTFIFIVYLTTESSTSDVVEHIR